MFAVLFYLPIDLPALAKCLRWSLVQMTIDATTQIEEAPPADADKEHTLLRFLLAIKRRKRSIWTAGGHNLCKWPPLKPSNIQSRTQHGSPFILALEHLTFVTRQFVPVLGDTLLQITLSSPGLIPSSRENIRTKQVHCCTFVHLIKNQHKCPRIHEFRLRLQKASSTLSSEHPFRQGPSCQSSLRLNVSSSRRLSNLSSRIYNWTSVVRTIDLSSVRCPGKLKWTSASLWQ